MRHRARRPLVSRLLALGPLLSSVLLRLRRAVAGGVVERPLAAFAAAAVGVVIAGVGVALAVGQQHSDPVSAAVPSMTETEAGTADPTPGQHPSQRVSRSGDRKSLSPSGDASPSPSPTDPAGDETLVSLAPSLSTASSDPASPKSTPTRTKTARPKPSDSSSPLVSLSPSLDPSPDPSPDPAPDPSPDPPADDVPPETTATTAAVDGSSWTVLLGADEPATFACSLDGGAFALCPVTAVFSGLSRGTHTLAAQATDLAGNTDPTPVQLTAKVHGHG